jgi:hypothetical protein
MKTERESMPEETESVEPVVEMADESVETPVVETTEEAVEEVAEVVQPDDVLTEEPAVEVEAPVIETPSEDEAPAEEVAEVIEDQADEESAEETEAPADVAAVLARLDALEALLTREPGAAEEDGLEALKVRAEKAERDLLAFKFATRYGLPEELADRLQGVDEASFEEDAQKLASLLGGGTGGLGKGGLDPNEESFDPKAVAAAYRKANGSR